ncbi:MAG: MarR family transcriptional regulator [Negativicutes bacterium]|nr:MarR family transcriptional regulator [Negativicutes bacterium]
MQGFFRRCLLLNRTLITKLNEALAAHGLTYPQWTVIYYVKDQGHSTLVDIANYASVKKPIITRTVQSLEERGIVRQIPGTDRREKIIVLTESGERIYQACRKLIDNLEQKVLEGIPEEEKRAAFNILPMIRDNLINCGSPR